MYNRETPVKINDPVQCCGAGRSRAFLLELEPVKTSRLRSVAVRLRGSEVAELQQFL